LPEQFCKPRGLVECIILGGTKNSFSLHCGFNPLTSEYSS